MQTPSNIPDRTPSPSPHGESPARAFTLRALVLGVIVTTIINLWLHHAELTLSGRGHSAISNTSIPLGAFDVLFALAAVNLLVGFAAPSLRLRRGELITIYTMSAVSTVLSSSGGLHFLLPALTSPFFFATRENRWAELFHPYIPDWMAVKDRNALTGFYYGNREVDWGAWLAPLASWLGFLTVFAFSTLCLSLILRRLWVDNEKLPFPTVTLPLELTREGVPLFRNRLFWAGLALTLGLQVLNTLSWNIPQVPSLNTRGIRLENWQLSPPWDSIASTQLSVFGFAVGIGYLLSTEVAFSCWFFFLITRAEIVWGKMSGWSLGAAQGALSAFPWIGHQGAGAYLGITLALLWMGRRYFASVWRCAIGRPPKGFEDEARVYRFALAGFAASLAAMAAFCIAGGIQPRTAVVFLLLTLTYLIAATRTRAETGNVWPTGPDVDAYSLMYTVAGTRIFSPADLTVLLFVRSATAAQDFRGACMPHQLDALKMGPEGGLRVGQVALALMLATVLGVVISAIIVVTLFTHLGAVARIDAWRGLAGLRAFDAASTLMHTPRDPDPAGTAAVGFGMLTVFALMAARVQWVWWPFHPLGYAMANTPPMNSAWVSMLVAWAAKVIIVRTGGMRLYRQALPFFLGLIAGDFLGGGSTTLAAILFGTNAYPANW